MKLIQSTLERSFTVTYKGKTYYVDYLNSDGYLCMNRLNWEALDEELEELNIYVFKGTTKKELKQIKKNVKLYSKLINFCIKRFNDYKPDPNDC